MHVAKTETDHQTELGPQCKSANTYSLISLLAGKSSNMDLACYSVTLDDLMQQASNQKLIESF